MGNGKHGQAPVGAQDKAEIEAVLARVNRRVRELRAFDPAVIQDRWDARLEQLQKNVNKVVGEAFGMGTPLYKQHAIPPLDSGLDSTFGDRYSIEELREEVRKAMAQASIRLAAVTRLLTERLATAPEGDPGAAAAPQDSAPAPLAAMAAEGATPAPAPAPTAAPTPAPALLAAPAPVATLLSPPATAPASTSTGTASMNTTATPGARSKRIAIVCRDDAAGEAVTRFVAQLGLEPVLSQQPRADAASLEALEALRQAEFALVLQAERQLEVGFLLAALGRARLCVLHAGAAPDALPGLPHHAIDEGGLWKLLLAREMKQNGVDVDLNKAI